MSGDCGMVIGVWSYDPARPKHLVNCPKCEHLSGDDWSQCGGVCPMPVSPHFDPKHPQAGEAEARLVEMRRKNAEDEKLKKPKGN